MDMDKENGHAWTGKWTRTYLKENFLSDIGISPILNEKTLLVQNNFLQYWMSDIPEVIFNVGAYLL
jgi:hypothetical protein